MSQWYAKTAGQTLDELGSGRSGLSPRLAQERLEKYGPSGPGSWTSFGTL